MHSKEAKEGEGKKISVLKRLLKGLGVEDEMFESINEEVQKEMKLDGETEKEKELSALIYALHLNLRWKKYLIVFDDVRKEDKWDEKLDEKLKKDVKWGKHLSDGSSRTFSFAGIILPTVKLLLPIFKIPTGFFVSPGSSCLVLLLLLLTWKFLKIIACSEVQDDQLMQLTGRIVKPFDS